MRKLTLRLIRNEEGMLLPFLAICIAIMILFATLGLGLSAAYADRMVIRDALDAAASAALTQSETESMPTYYGERYIDGDPGYWIKTTSNYKDRIKINKSQAEAAARAYLVKNLNNNGLQHTILDFNLSIEFDQGNKLQIHKHRPNTEGIITSWEEHFPRYVTATITARIEVPVPMGGIVEKETLVVGMATRHYKELR